DLRGVARRHRGMGVASAVLLLALAGVPPLALWASKDEILAGIEDAALHAVGLAAAAVSAVYAGRVLVVALSRPDGAEARDVEERGTRRVPTPATAMAGVLAVAAAALGVLAVPDVAHALEDVLDLGTQATPSVADLASSGGLAIAALALTVLRPGLVARLGATMLRPWAGLPRLLSPRPVLAIAHA